MAVSFGRIDSTRGREQHNVPPPEHDLVTLSLLWIRLTKYTQAVPEYCSQIRKHWNTWFYPLYCHQFKLIDKFLHFLNVTKKWTSHSRVTSKVFVDFTSLLSASEIVNQLEFSPNQSKHLSSNFSTSHCCSASNHLLSKKHQLVLSNSTFKKQTSLWASVNIDADRQPRCEDTSVPPSHEAASLPMVLE